MRLFHGARGMALGMAAMGGGLGFASAEVGTVDASTVVVRFNRQVAATNALTGVTIKVGGAGVTVNSGTIQADKRLVYYALDAPIVGGDVVTWEYAGATGNITDLLTSVALASVTARAVTNNVSGAMAGYYMGCLGLTYSA